MITIRRHLVHLSIVLYKYIHISPKGRMYQVHRVSVVLQSCFSRDAAILSDFLLLHKTLQRVGFCSLCGFSVKFFLGGAYICLSLGRWVG